MDAEELAFAGAARQAELIRSGEVSSRELVELYLERIERLDPKLNAFTEVLGERALAEAEAADARRGAGDDAAARGPDRDQGQRRRRGRRRRGSAPAPSTTPGRGRRRVRAPAARGRRGDHRQDDAARAGDLRLHRDRRAGARPATRGTPSARPGGSSGGSGAAVAAGLVGRRLGHRRRRLDPHPGGLLRPLRAQAPARPRAARAARPLERALGSAAASTRTVADTALYLDVVRRRRRPGRPGRPSAVRGGRATPAGCASRSRTSRRGRSCRRSSPTRSRPGSPRPRSCCARSATTCAATTRASA